MYSHTHNHLLKLKLPEGTLAKLRAYQKQKNHLHSYISFVPAKIKDDTRANVKHILVEKKFLSRIDAYNTLAYLESIWETHEYWSVSETDTHVTIQIHATDLHRLQFGTGCRFACHDLLRAKDKSFQKYVWVGRAMLDLDDRIFDDGLACALSMLSYFDHTHVAAIVKCLRPDERAVARMLPYMLDKFGYELKTNSAKRQYRVYRWETLLSSEPFILSLIAMLAPPYHTHTVYISDQGIDSLMSLRTGMLYNFARDCKFKPAKAYVMPVEQYRMFYQHVVDSAADRAIDLFMSVTVRAGAKKDHTPLKHASTEVSKKYSAQEQRAANGIEPFGPKSHLFKLLMYIEDRHLVDEHRRCFYHVSNTLRSSGSCVPVATFQSKVSTRAEYAHDALPAVKFTGKRGKEIEALVGKEIIDYYAV